MEIVPENPEGATLISPFDTYQHLYQDPTISDSLSSRGV
jgi:hypothetical protein